MITRRFERTYRVPASPAAVWEHLSDPAAVGAASSHPVRVEDRTPGFGVGTRWVEVHDDACGSPPVPWVVTTCDPPSAAARSFTVEGRQSGARQRATTAVRAVEGGAEVTASMELRPSLRPAGGSPSGSCWRSSASPVWAPRSSPPSSSGPSPRTRRTSGCTRPDGRRPGPAPVAVAPARGPDSLAP